MPPKRKSRASVQNASSPATDDDLMAIDTPVEEEDLSNKPKIDLPQDSWTFEQETSLFQAIMQWKPAGMHKHFRMIAISENLRNHGYDPRILPHTSIPGIWAKLRTLYNLEVIDEREDSFDYNEDVEKKYLEFSLPEQDYGKRMFEQGRQDTKESSSPSRMDEPVKKTVRRGTLSKVPRGSTVEGTDDGKSSPAGSVATRTGRRGTRTSGRISKVGSSDKETTVEAEEEDDDEDTEMQSPDAADKTEEEEDAEDDDNGTPSPKVPRTSARGRGRGRGRGRPQSTTRKSGRHK